VIFNQYGQREQADRLEVKPPIDVESATWSAAGILDYWVKEEREWWGRASAGQTAIRRGSELLIYVSPVLSISSVRQQDRRYRPVGFRDDPHAVYYARVDDVYIRHGVRASRLPTHCGNQERRTPRG
jgi:hypothetical protein